MLTIDARHYVTSLAQFTEVRVKNVRCAQFVARSFGLFHVSGLKLHAGGISQIKQLILGLTKIYGSEFTS